jgi:hypothetical protein
MAESSDHPSRIGAASTEKLYLNDANFELIQSAWKAWKSIGSGPP